LIDIRNLSKVYSDSKTPIVALDNINIQIDKGEIYGIVGLSGAGKSSLVRCINRIEEPTSGEIYIDKINIMDLNQKNLRKIRKKISMIFQGFNLLNSKTVYENIAFPLKLDKLPKSEINARVNELLSWVELSDKANAYPSQLSGGQKQRVAIARALASKPDILLSDEATSALDPKTTNQILSMLKRINKEMNITIVVITHEMEVVKSICDKTVVLENGRIIAQGNTIDIFSNKDNCSPDIFSKEESLDYKEHYKGELLKLSFVGENAKNPIISNLVKKFDLELNIISGNIEYIQEKPLGTLIVELKRHDNLRTIIDYLNNHDVQAEVL